MSQSESAPDVGDRAPGTLASDLRAGFLVFLIALPLCLGISVASGFPPIAGVMTAIIGGVIASFLGSSRLTIKGPAAGLIVIAIGAVMELGEGDLTLGYKRALAVGAMAAVVQIVFALLRFATVGIAMSPSVVHGMLAAIGVIIISKQAHTVVGVTPEAGEPLELLAEIPHSVMHANPEILLIGVVSLVLLFGWPLLRRFRWAQVIPAPMGVLAIAVPLGLIFDLPHAHSYDFWSGHYEVGPEFLVSLPGNLLDAVTMPDFSVMFSPTSLKYVVMFALVGTIESTLSVLAVDSLDPEKQASDLNKDLLCVGVGNLACAMVGGLPMISEIVRSKANIDAGARTNKANFFHGAFLLLFVAAFPGLLQTIPLAALGAMLVYTGARLASPQELVHAKKIGADQLLLFTVTLLVTLATDLLIGVGVGLVLKIILHLGRGARLRTLFRPRLEEQQHEDVLRLRVVGDAAFPCLLTIRKRLGKVEAGTRSVVLDLSDVTIVDHTFLSRIEAMADELPDCTVTVEGTDEMIPASDHPMSSRRRSS